MTTKRGRKSAGDLTVVPISGARIAMPGHLTPEQAEEWRSIVDSLPADYFRPADVALLGAFCVASALYKQAAAMIQAEGIVLEDDRGRKSSHPASNILVTQANSMATMAIKLRLCPQSRYSEKRASTKADAGAGARPWEVAG